MNIKKLTIISLSLAAFLSGCGTIVPGSGLSTKHKTVIYEENESEADTQLDSRVNVYPITLSLIDKMRLPPILAQNNHNLEQRKLNYNYTLGTGDVLNIMVWSHPDLNPTSTAAYQNRQVSSGTWVNEQGYIFYPLVGQLYVRGKTLHEVHTELTNRLKRYIKSPQININITEFRSQNVSISGSVRQPGRLPITNTPLTLLDALDLAGGLTNEADSHNIKWTHNGIDRTISVQDILQYGDLSQNHLLSNGDIVYIPTNENSKVFVMGEVGRQSALRMAPTGYSLTEALGEAQGMNQDLADATGVFVIRNAPLDREKPIHVYQLNLKDASAYALGNQFKLRANDVVYVTAAPLARWNRVVQQATGSISNVTDLNNSF